VLIPVYTTGTTGGAHFIRATWRATLNPRLLVSSSHKMITNSNPPGRTYTQPGAPVARFMDQQFKRVGDRLFLVRRNVRFQAKAGTVVYVPSDTIHSGKATPEADVVFFTVKDASHSLHGMKAA